MNTLSNFQFHKFNINSPRNFYNSYEFTNRQKSRTNPKGFYNNINNNTLNNNTLNNNRYNNITPTFFSQQIPSKNNMNKLNKLSQDIFPTKKITNTDFESVLKFGDSNKIDELLPHMIYNDLSFAKNNHLRLVLSKYQNLLKYLFSQQQSLLNKNNKIETMFNNKNSNMNKKIKQLENDEFKMDSLYKSNKNTIEKLKEKIKNYKNILISSGKGNLIPKNFSKTFNKNGIYRCQICLGKTFNNNEDLQQHYIKEHYNISNKEININNNNNGKTDLTKSYLNKKLSIFKNELQEMILTKFQQNNNGQNNISKIKLNSQYNNNNNNIKMSNFNLLSNDEETKNINDYLDRLEYEQKEQYAQLNNKISQMKNEVFNELKNIKMKPQIINENNQNINQEQTNLNLNNEKSQINENIIGNINNEKNQLPINNEDNNNKNIELNNPQMDINIPENNNNNNNKSNVNNNDDLKNNDINNNFNNDINDNLNTNNNIENKINNNNEQNEQINSNPFKPKESRDPENNELTDNNKNDVINSNQPNNDDEGRNNPININININNQENNNNNEIRENNENINNNINPSTIKYIDQKNIIEEVSGRKESTMNNLTQNNITNPQNISTDKEEKFFTNTGDSVNINAVTGQNQKLYNKNVSHFSFNKENQEPMEKDEFINKIKERDENILLDKDKNLSQIEINYDVINVKNENNLEQKKENLIKEQENKYLNDNLQNLEIADYENIIKNIMKDTKEKIGKDKKYKEFFDNIIQKKDLVDLDLLFKDLQISNINVNENETKINISNTKKISALGDSKDISKNISMKKSNNYSKNLDFLERKNNSDFL